MSYMVPVALVILMNADSVFAQNSQVSNRDNAVVTYEKDFFDKYSPVTLLDILERIPGIQGVIAPRNNQGSGGGRGFGSSGDQILLNGKRITAKSNSIRDILARTTASSVERIELIRGAADGLDVQTEGLVINVILTADAGSASIFWKFEGVYMIGHNFSPQFETSYKNKSGNLDYTVALEGNSRRGNFFRDEIFFDENNIRTGEKDMDGNFHFKQIKANTNLSYNFENGDILNLNGQYRSSSIVNNQLHVETGDDAEILFWDFREKFLQWEAGGDYTTDVGFLGELKTRFVINRRQNSDNGAERFEGTGNNRFLYVNELIDFSADEDIYRASLTNSLGSNMSLEVGGEGAFNTFRQKFDNFEREAADDPLELNTSNNIVIKEKRYEIFAHHNYTISSKMALQTSLTTEFSQITADTLLAAGDIRVDNSFTFIKPRMNFRYDFNDTNQLRLTAEKKVSQLEFFHYLTFFDQQEQELKFGNNNIRPEQIWEFSATYEYRLPNDGGTIEAEIFYHDYKDYIARIDFTEYMDFSGNSISADQFFALPPDANLRDEIDFDSKPGNVDHAEALGLSINGDVRLGLIGLPEAKLTLGYELERRRYFDPISQRKRNFSWEYDNKYKAALRHDVTSFGLSYGIEAEYGSGFEHGDITNSWQWDGQLEYELFVEKKIFNDIKMRIDFSQERGTNARNTFFRYTDHIRFGESKGRDEQYVDRPYEASIEFSGTF